MVGTQKVVATLVYGAVVFGTLYLFTKIAQYGLMILMCTILIIVGSLLWIHCDGASAREALWSMTRRDRQQFHAKRLPAFSVIPTKRATSNFPEFIGWREGEWRKLADATGEQLSKDIAAGKLFVRNLDDYTVRSGWPTVEEVERCDNTIVLSVRGLWAGLAARINPVLNAFLNRFVKCWNRSLMYCGIRLSAYGLPYPAVSLDFPTADVATLNFGQKDDCLVMSYVYDLVRKTYPKAKIILLSVCLGGLRILNWLSRNPNPLNVIGVVLESPLPSVRHLLKGFLHSYFNEDLYNTFCLIVPNFRPELEDQYSFFRKLKQRGPSPSTKEGMDAQISRIPMFLGFIDSDTFSNKSHLPLFCDRFPNLTVFNADERTSEEHGISHGKLYRLPAYRTAVQAFVAAIRSSHPQKLEKMPKDLMHL